jgi:formiminotetrahydrofolate cyclodeaminase
MQLDRFDVSQILEYKLRGKGKQSTMDFLHELALSKPTPGGGSVAALQAALGSALLAMVTGITEHKTKDKELFDIHGPLKLQAYEFYKYIEKDKNAFDAVIKAFKLPENDEIEKKDKNDAIQQTYKHAALVPMDVCRKIIALYPYARTVANKGLKKAISDVGVALYSLHSGFMGARINILINLNSIIDEKFNQTIRIELDSLNKQEDSLYAEIENIFLTKL